MKRLQVLAVLILVPFLTFADSSGRQLQIFFDGSGRHSALPVPVVAPQSIPLLPPDAGAPVGGSTAEEDIDSIIQRLQSGDSSAVENQRMLMAIQALARRIQRDHPGDTSTKKLRDGALRGMLHALDRHSELFIPEEWSRFRESQENGNFGGIGATLEKLNEGDFIFIRTPIPTTPAARAGLHAGDSITEVNGEDTRSMSLDVAVSKIRGPVGTSVKLTVRSFDGKSLSAPHEVVLVRAVIDVPNLYSAMVDSETGYIFFQLFSENSSDEFKRALGSLKAKGMKKLVVDLRGNPGGLLDEAVKMCRLFVNHPTTIVTTRGKNESEEEATTSDGPCNKIPIAVLVDEWSASASEIMGGVLQDTKRAKLVGSHTYGKGSVQVISPDFPEPGYAFKITVAKYYLPSGRGIEGDGSGKGGLTPDIAVKVPFDVAVKLADARYYKLMRQTPKEAVVDPVLNKALEYLKTVPGQK